MTEVSDEDILLLRLAIEESALAAAAGDPPYGAVLASADSHVVARGRNESITRGDATSHAELNALRTADRLAERTCAGLTIFSSAEPCAMCTAASYYAGVERIVFAMAGSETRAFHSDRPMLTITAAGLLRYATHQFVTLEGPVLAEDARSVHDSYWSAQ